MHQLDRAFVQSSLDDAIARRAPLSFDYRILLADAVERTLHAELVTVLDKGGCAVCLTGTIQDITERKHAEEQIRQLAYYDALTGLPNRRFFLQQLEQALVFANRNDRINAEYAAELRVFAVRRQATLAEPDPDVRAAAIATPTASHTPLYRELAPRMDGIFIANHLSSRALREPDALSHRRPYSDYYMTKVGQYGPTIGRC